MKMLRYLFILSMVHFSWPGWSSESSCKELFRSDSLQDLRLSSQESHWVNRTNSDLIAHGINFKDHLDSIIEYISKNGITSDNHLNLLFENLFVSLRNEALEKTKGKRDSRERIFSTVFLNMSISEAIIKKGFLRYLEEIQSPSNSKKISLRAQARLFFFKLFRSKAWRLISLGAFFQPPEARYKQLPEPLFEAIFLEGSDAHEIEIQSWAKANSNRLAYSQIRTSLARVILGVSLLFLAHTAHREWIEHVESSQAQMMSQLDHVDHYLDAFNDILAAKKKERLRVSLSLAIEKFQLTVGRISTPAENLKIRDIIMESTESSEDMQH